MLELPSSLDPFVAELQREGFVITDSRYDATAFGNGLLELASASDQRVRFVCDRGQWWIEVAVGSTWQDPYLVVLALDRSPYVRRALSHTEQVRHTRDAVSRLATGSVDQVKLLAQLDRLRAEGWNDRFGAPTR